jgi:hypothetical protein
MPIALTALRNRLADPAKAENANGPATELGRELGPALFPTALVQETVKTDEPSSGHHDQRDRDVGDVIVNTSGVLVTLMPRVRQYSTGTPS